MTDTIVGKQISMKEAVEAGLYDGAMRSDPEYKEMVEKITGKIKVGWLRKLAATMIGKTVEITMAQALEAAGHPLPGIVSKACDYKVHKEWIVHECAQWINYMRAKPRAYEMMQIARQRRNFHRQHQFEGFTQIKPRGTSQPSFIPLWTRVY